MLRILEDCLCTESRSGTPGKLPGIFAAFELGQLCGLSGEGCFLVTV